MTSASAVAAGPRPTQRRASSSLSLLNAFELSCEGQLVTLPPSAQRLLAFVALRAHPLRRAYVAGVLWTDATEERAAANLRSCLWRLHRPGYRLVDATSTQVRLASEVDVDIRGVSRLAHDVAAGSKQCHDTSPLHSALGGELLPDWYDDWVLFERERFRQVGLHALEALADQGIAAGRLRQALDAALRAVQVEPLRESAHRAVIRVHLAEGNVCEALRQSELCRALLRERLDLAPSPQLEELVRPLTHRRWPGDAVA